MANDKQGFPEQDEPLKIHGTTEESKQKEKYIRDSGKIEDLPSQDDEVSKMSTNVKDADEDESANK